MIRDAEPGDWAQFVGELPSYMVPVWGGLIVEDGEVRGHGFVSRVADRYFLHDLAYSGSNPYAVAALYQRGRAVGKALGIQTVYTEVDPSSKTRRLYERLGFAEHSLVMEGPLVDTVRELS